MILHIFSIHDSKAEAYITPFFSQTPATALRDFESACKQEGHQFQRFAADYTLFLLGTFEADKAKFNLEKTPINLAQGHHFTQSQSPSLANENAEYNRASTKSEFELTNGPILENLKR